MRGNYETLKKELLKDNNIANITAASSRPLTIGNNNPVYWEGRTSEQYEQMNFAQDDVDYSVSFRVQSLLDILPGNSLSNHLGSTAPMEPVYILVAVALMIALAAGFNYTNLSMAKAISRAREVGIRKVVGAKRFQLFFQFTGEAIIISLISLFLAFLFYGLLNIYSLRTCFP